MSNAPSPAVASSANPGADWQAYKNQFEKDGRTLSVQDVFRDAMMRTEDGNRMANLPRAEREDLNDEK